MQVPFDAPFVDFGYGKRICLLGPYPRKMNSDSSGVLSNLLKIFSQEQIL